MLAAGDLGREARQHGERVERVVERAVSLGAPEEVARQRLEAVARELGSEDAGELEGVEVLAAPEKPPEEATLEGRVVRDDGRVGDERRELAHDLRPRRRSAEVVVRETGQRRGQRW